MEKLETAEDYAVVLDEIENQNDRGAAITAAAFLDNHLTKAITSRLIPLSVGRSKNLFGGSGPFGTYEAKIDVAFALGLVSEKLVGDLKIIGQVRNKFAHRMKPITFDERAITELCNQLVLGTATRMVDPDARKARRRYVRACKLLMAFIIEESKSKEAPTGPRLHPPGRRAHSRPK